MVYLRNTVDDALAAHVALSARGLDPMLFHARFAMADRLRIEEAVVDTFGRRSEPAQRRGRYRGSGSASYHPRLLLGLLVYGYATSPGGSGGWIFPPPDPLKRLRPLSPVERRRTGPT